MALRELSEHEAIIFQQAILPVIATGLDGSFRPVGTCWIFALAGRQALAFSAAHVFDEIVRSEERHDLSAPSMPDLLRPLKPKAVALGRTRLKAIYRRSMSDAVMVDIHRVHRDGSLDVAVCVLEFEPDSPAGAGFERKLAIHSGPVYPNTSVAVVGYGGMERTRPLAGMDGDRRVALHFQQLVFNHGVCTGYFPQRGVRGSAAPCFEINAVAQHGMSGGPILHKGYGDLIVGCGVVSRATTFGGDETTTAAALWPAYSFDMPELADAQQAPLTLADLAKTGHIDDKSDGPAHFKFIERPETGLGTITWTEG